MHCNYSTILEALSNNIYFIESLIREKKITLEQAIFLYNKIATVVEYHKSETWQYLEEYIKEDTYRIEISSELIYDTQCCSKYESIEKPLFFSEIFDHTLLMLEKKFKEHRHDLTMKDIIQTSLVKLEDTAEEFPDEFQKKFNPRIAVLRDIVFGKNKAA